MIGYWLAKTLDDALQFCGIVDIMILLMHLYNFFVDKDATDVNFEGAGRGTWAGWGAAVGLAAAVAISKNGGWKNVSWAQALKFAQHASLLAALFFFIDFVSSITGLGHAKEMIDDGEVTVGFWFWPLSFLNSIIWLLVTANHLLLSRFVFLITKSERSLYQTTPNHDVI